MKSKRATAIVISAAIVCCVAIAIVVLARRPMNRLDYQIDSEVMVQVGQKDGQVASTKISIKDANEVVDLIGVADRTWGVDFNSYAPGHRIQTEHYSLDITPNRLVLNDYRSSRQYGTKLEDAEYKRIKDKLTSCINASSSLSEP